MSYVIRIISFDYDRTIYNNNNLVTKLKLGNESEPIKHILLGSSNRKLK